MATATEPGIRAIPRQLVEHFLLGRAGPGELQRFTQDAGIVADVWLNFAQDLSKPRRILFTPVDGVPAIDAATAVHDALWRYREEPSASDDALRAKITRAKITTTEWTNVAPLESFVAATVYFDELIRVLLPLTQWWSSKNLSVLQGEPLVRSRFREYMENYISHRLGNGPMPRPFVSDTEGTSTRRRSLDWKVLEATSIVALIGLFAAVAHDPGILFPLFNGAEPAKWTANHAETIAKAAVAELQRSAAVQPAATLVAFRTDPDAPGAAIIQRIFLDRESQLAETEAICTVKADAASLVFDISCRSLTWAIIDSGIAATHPAFREFKAGSAGDHASRLPRSRVRKTFDFTHIDLIRNLDLTTGDEIGRAMVIENTLWELKQLPGPRAANFEKVARENLGLIAEQLRRRQLPDWSLIEPLIRIGEDDGAGLSSDHGTHVAGILAADWREPPEPEADGAAEEVVLRGICPDISLYDLRVLHPNSIKNTEFAIIAALEFVRYQNSRAAGPPLIHGVNVSLSIPHEVRNYGCGATPVCVACDDLVQTGVVVVAAAGNRGWNERELGFGNFVFCSITDPGNAQRVITVGATHRAKPHTYGVSYFSSRGPTGDGRVKPDLVAPGEKIRGPIRGGADDELDGTSMAAPFVSGAAAMLMARNRELMRNPQRIKEILCKSATDLGRERYFQGHGLVDVLRALQSI